MADDAHPSANLQLLPLKRVVARFPEIRLLPSRPRSEDLDAIAECLSIIFGSPEPAEDGHAIWGEGSCCAWCGAQFARGDNRECSCGSGQRIGLNDVAFVREELQNLFRPAPDWQPIGCVLEQAGRTVGFGIGAVGSPRKVELHLAHKIDEYAARLALEGIDVRGLDIRSAIPRSNPILYAEDVAVEIGARAGGRAAHGLFATLLTAAAELGARGAVGYTTRSSVIARLLESGGGEVRLDMGRLMAVTFENLLPLTTLLGTLETPELMALVRG
jgi:hypothetical protein